VEDAKPEPTFASDGRRCPNCGAVSPREAAACIVCGGPPSGPPVSPGIGAPVPVVEITREPGQRIYAETGALGWMTEDVQMKTVIQGSPWAMLGRAVSGMTPLGSQFGCEESKGVVAFTPRVPGQIVPIMVDREHEYILQSGTFLAA